MKAEKLELEFVAKVETYEGGSLALMDSPVATKDVYKELGCIGGKNIISLS